MNHRLTCDEVFDHLTRAPFPAGEETDRGVDEHLLVCHECRQMAEALRPATDLFREVLAQDERRGLPAYRGQLTSMARDPRRAWPAQFTSWNPVRFVAGSPPPRRYFLPALGLTLLLMVAILHGPGLVGDLSTLNLPVKAAAGSDHAANCVIAGLALPPDCLPRLIVGPPRAKPRDPSTRTRNGSQSIACVNCHEFIPSTLSQACCTNCHAASIERTSGKSLFPRLATSCAQCHDVQDHGAGSRG